MKGEQVYLQHILDAIELIEHYAAGGGKDVIIRKGNL